MRNVPDVAEPARTRNTVPQEVIVRAGHPWSV